MAAWGCYITLSRDGIVRSARLHTKTTELVRSVTKIILLEASVVSPSAVINIPWY